MEHCANGTRPLDKTVIKNNFLISQQKLLFQQDDLGLHVFVEKQKKKKKLMASPRLDMTWALGRMPENDCL